MATTDTLSPAQLRAWSRFLPFWVSLLLLPLLWIGAVFGGWLVILVPLVGWYVFAGLDAIAGLDVANGDPLAEDRDLQPYILLTTLWAPLQAICLFGLIAFVAGGEHLSALEKFGLFFGMGVISGTIGINYSHELMHQQSRLERSLADLLLAMVMYGHFRSEHLLVHHRYVATPRDPVTARYNESFFRFYPRVLWQCLRSAARAEAAQQARKNRPWYHQSNPFWRYIALQLLCLMLAFALGGFGGVILFFVQAGVAIWQLELVNYIEHYGLSRKHLGDGKYEPVKPRHSWNAAHRFSNWLLINLQRHSDHHYRPKRRFPLLQTYDTDEAPQLPYGYPVMTIAAMIPPLWRRIMNPRVRSWRRQYYPEITDWQPYNKARNPVA